jgi:hypothetical protein
MSIVARLLLVTMWVVFCSNAANASGRIALLSPVALQTLKTNSDAQELTLSLAGAIDRVPGVQSLVASNDPNKPSAAAFVIDGSNLAAAGLVSSSPSPQSESLNTIANPMFGGTDELTITGRNVRITPIGSSSKPERNIGVPAFLVEPTLIIDPANSSNLTLYIFVTRHDGGGSPGGTTTCHWQVSGGAAQLNSLLSKVDLSSLFDPAPAGDLGTLLVIPQRSTELSYANRVEDRLSISGLSFIPNHSMSLQSARSDLSTACASAGARTILAWGIETDKETRMFGFSGYHAHASFDLLNCLPTDYNPPSVSVGLYRSAITNIPGVIASIGAILQTTTRMTVAPIANILSGSTIAAIFPAADDTQNSTKAVDAALNQVTNKLCDYLVAAALPSVAETAVVVASPKPTATPSRGCAGYRPAMQIVNRATPTPTYPPAPIPPATPSPSPQFFIVHDGNGGSIRVRLEDPSLISKAKQAIAASDPNAAVHIQGTIVREQISYEQGWEFYLDPHISFFSVSTASDCNKPLSYIKDHLSELGSESLLPRKIWCPWNSRIATDDQPRRKTGSGRK